MTTIREAVVKLFWSALTWIGLRRLIRMILSFPNSPYQHTIFYFEPSQLQQRCVALTIDDGLCRQDYEKQQSATDAPQHHSSYSLTNRVLETLAKYSAHATFFVCTKYTTTQNVQTLLQHGHEVGNHLEEDLSGYYPRLSATEFGAVLDRTNTLIEEATNQKCVWFRAPQGILTNTMQAELSKRDMIHVLGDCYCDDWAIASDPHYICDTMLRQLKQQAVGGNIMILHMPEKGFRETSLVALELLLSRLQAEGFCRVTLSEMMRRSQEPHRAGDR